MSTLARLEARDASATETPLDVLRAVAADLRLCGLVSRATIRRVCAATSTTASPEVPEDQQAGRPA